MSDKCIAVIDALIARRQEKSLTQRDLAKVINLAQPAIARLESKAVTPQLDTILIVAAARECRLEIIPINR